MKNTIISLKQIGLMLMLLVFGTLQQFSIAQSPSNAQCTILGNNLYTSLTKANGDPMSAIQTGLEFNLNLTLPGQLSCVGGTYSVSIGTTDNLIIGSIPSTYPYLFNLDGTTQRYINSSVLPSDAGGIGINIPFKFRPGVTCNDSLGKFDVRVTLLCNGTTIQCTMKVSLKAIAKNYWKFEKKHIANFNLRGGNLVWDVIITNTNPTPGIGDYNMPRTRLIDEVSDGYITQIRELNGPVVFSATPAQNINTATWDMNYINSGSYGTSNPIVYRITSTSCLPAGSTVENCVKYSGPLGASSQIFCSKITPGRVCAKVRLVDRYVVAGHFTKTLTYQTNSLNYAPGCEAEYTIRVSNNGNTPINNLVISDVFPAGISVSQITVSSVGVYVPYTITGIGASGTFNTSIPQSWTTSSSFAHFTLSTLPNTGSLIGGYIDIRVRFRINGSTAVGAIVSNCANLNFTGTFIGMPSGNTICDVPAPSLPIPSGIESCVKFTVQAPMAIPGITKCIRGGQQSHLVGGIIPFRIVVSNHGGLSYSGNLTDLLNLNQNLELVPGSVTYSSGIGPLLLYSTATECMSHFGTGTSSNPLVSVTSQTTNNLGWSINGLPGMCDLDKASYLIIEFDAKVLPQSYGNYCNRATLSTLSSSACYNIMREAKIVVNKTANVPMVAPGQSFNYLVNVVNAGSVALRNVFVEDYLPTCVQFSNQTAKKTDALGNQTTVTATYSAPNFNFGSLILLPGDSIQLTINVIRSNTDQGPECCNPKAKSIGVTTDAVAQSISDERGPACVKNALCCDIESVDIQFNTANINNSIVPVFWINSGPLPIQEIEISLMDYHVQYSSPYCKPANIGSLTGHIQPFVGTVGGTFYDFNGLPSPGTPLLSLQTVVNPATNSLTWTGDMPINLTPGWNFNGLIAVNFVAPEVIPLRCCAGTVYYCFKVRIKDVDCKVCEKIVCGKAILPKTVEVHWISDQAKDAYKIQNLGKTETGTNAENKTIDFKTLMMPRDSSARKTDK